MAQAENQQAENQQSDRSLEKQAGKQSSSESNKPNTSGDGFQRHAHPKAMENCIALFLKLGAAASPTTTLSQKQKALIEERLLDSFLVHQRPDHLPYAAMIITAIEKLSEKGGSSEEAISGFIRKENHELPWAHDTFVKHHLDILLKEGSVFKTRYGLYTTDDADRVSDDADRVSTDADLFIPSDDSGSQSPMQKKKLRKGRILRIKLETKRGRPRKMNTSRVKQESEKNEEKKPKRVRPRKMKKEKEYQKKKKRHNKVDVVDDGVIRETNASRVNLESEKSKETELTLVPSCSQTETEDRVNIGSELQPNEEEAEAHEKEFDHLIGPKDTLLVNKTNSQLVEETNQLQEHNLAPVGKQWLVYKRDQLLKGSRKGQKARTKLADTSGRG